MLMCRAVVSIIVLIALIVVVMAATKEDRHIIVVGGGLAGLSAALEAARNGAKVTLVEGEKDVGGNSMKASSGINGCWTETQKKLGIKDNVSIFFSDTMSAGDNLNIGDLVDILVHDSKESVEWLTEKGVNLADVNILGGHSVPRTHWIPSPKEGKPNPIGVAIIRALKSHYAELQSLKPDEMKLVTSTKATALIHDEDGKRVIGVKTRTSEGQEGEIRGTAVILTTGGFSNDHTDDSLLRQYAPEYLRYPTTNGPFAQGSGVKMAREIGARLIHMGFVQVHPTGFIDPKDPQAKTKFLAAEALRGSGAILLNQKGERFTNELGRRDHTTENILTHCQKDPVANAHTAWLIMNEPAVDKFGWPAFNFYYKIKGFFEKVGNAEELAEKINAAVEVVKKTLEDYKEIVSKTKTDPFGKKVFPVPFSTDETLYVGRITPSIHYTMGGLEINGKSEVISDKTRQPIPGLYAGGEVTGGVHGKNRLGGNSLLECVVFGRIAGLQAATN